ncbi:Unknown protein, partial [Striga hermonthica]
VRRPIVYEHNHSLVLHPRRQSHRPRALGACHGVHRDLGLIIEHLDLFLFPFFHKLLLLITRVNKLDQKILLTFMARGEPLLALKAQSLLMPLSHLFDRQSLDLRNRRSNVARWFDPCIERVRANRHPARFRGAEICPSPSHCGQVLIAPSSDLHRLLHGVWLLQSYLGSQIVPKSSNECTDQGTLGPPS